MTRIILVRHGRSMANVADIFAGITETPLTPHGLLQAPAVANYLFEHEKIDKVYASPLSRAMDTVRPTAERFGLSVIPDKGLIEVDGGRWEGLSCAELAEKYNGGGHACAAGATVYSRAEAKKLLAEADKILAEYKKTHEGWLQ